MLSSRTHRRPPPLNYVDPSTCPHSRSCRLGIQRFPFPPYRVYLLRCLACETTLTTGSLREQREEASGGNSGRKGDGDRAAGK